jgi:transposase
LRRYGRSPRGQRLHDHTPCSHWQTHTVICALRLEGVGAQLRFLPPCSPDFNPIEQAFAKLKAFLRAVRPRSFDTGQRLVAIALGLFTPDECRNYVRPRGYRVATP